MLLGEKEQKILSSKEHPPLSLSLPPIRRTGRRSETLSSNSQPISLSLSGSLKKFDWKRRRKRRRRRRRRRRREMAETTKDELVQLIKRFGAFLTLKMSNLFPISLDTLDSRSVGALAGLAVAMFFTWRLLRSPSGTRRRQPKRQAPAPSSSGASSHSNAPIIPSGVSSSSEARAQNVIDEFFQPVKPTLAQIVRQKLSEGRKVTCRLLGVILEESSPEELQKQATVRSSVLEVLLEITKFCDLYLMERVLDDESESKVLLALEEAGVFTSGGLVKDKVLFCSTETGRSSFVRQLEPDWHIDTNPEIIFQLARFIKYQLHVSPIRSERAAGNVFNSPSLEQFFGCI